MVGGSMPRQKKLKKRSDGRYCAVYKGKQFMSYDHDEAVRLRDEYKYRCEHSIDEIRKISVKDYASEWLQLHKHGKVQLNTYNHYAGLFDKMIAVIGDVHMSSVTPDDAARVWKVYNGQSKSQIDKALFLYRSFFDSAIENGYCRRNPFRSDSVDTPNGSAGSHRAIEDWERHLIETTPHRMQLAALVMLYAGLRRGEICALQYNHIHDNYFHVFQAVSFASTRPEIKGTKNDYSVREVPVLAPLRPLFFDDNGKPLKSFGYIISCEDGSVCTESSWDRAWESYIHTLETELNGVPFRWYHRTKEWKLSHPAEWQKYESLRKKSAQQAEDYRLMGWKSVTIRPHDLRHSFCEWAITNGVTPKTLMKWMGHRDEHMIMKIYDHVMSKREDAAIELLNNSYADNMQQHLSIAR